jgi:hypothetical protein
VELFYLEGCDIFQKPRWFLQRRGIEWLNGKEFQKTIGDIDQAKEFSEQTVSILNNVTKYVTQKIGDAKKEQEALQEILNNTKNVVLDLKGRLDVGEVK